MKKTYSTIKQIDENSFAITEHVIIQKKVGFNIKPKAIILGVLFIVFCMFIYNWLHTNNSEEYLQLNSTGFVFANSSKQLLTESDISFLKSVSKDSNYTYQELLRFSVNEIYARHGHFFSPNGKYSSFYSQFDWYKNLSKKQVTWNDFNQIEISNLTLILQHEKNNGFR